jgi:hypothetical protein
MGAHEALTAIIARCPDLLREATKALVALRADSPIADRRLAHVVAGALSQYGEEFTPHERAELAAFLTPDDADGEGARAVNLIVRVTPTERERVHEDARALGWTASDYVRGRLGLPTRAGGDNA